MKMIGIEKWFINKPHHAEQAIKRAEKLLQFVNMEEKQNLLEVGCGSGAVLRHFAEKYQLDVTGVDIDPEQIQLARENTDDIPNIRFLAADATNLPLPDNDFDIVLSFGVTHHISNWLNALREIKRVLKPKGHFIYADLIYTEWMTKFGRSFKHSYGIITMPDLTSFFQQNDFSPVHTSLKNSLFLHNYEAVYQRN